MLAQASVDTRAARREATKARILEAAWRLAERDGLAAMSLRDLGHEVGMRAPSLYRYFPSKNAIYDAMFAESVRMLGEAVSVEPKSDDPREALRQRARRFAAFFTAHPLRFQLIDQRPIPEFEPSPQSFAISVANVEEVRKDLEAAGVRGMRGLDLWRALITGLVSQQVSNEPGGNRWTRLIDEAIDMFLTHHASQGRTRQGGGRGGGRHRGGSRAGRARDGDPVREGRSRGRRPREGPRSNADGR